MKIYYTTLTLTFGSLAFGQVGINTPNPQATLHIDGKKDNSVTGTPNTMQQSNDFVVTEDGKVGTGTAFPDTRLDINNGTIAGAIKIVDGTQGANKVLMSDANGIGTWQSPASIRPTVVGSINTATKNVASETSIGSSITLPKGKWLVNIGQLITSMNPTTASNNLWMRIELSSSNVSRTTTGFTFVSSSRRASAWLSPARENTYQYGYSFLSGVIPIEVTADNVTIYTWFAECNPTAGYDAAILSPKIGDHGENYLFAIPIN
ncbi:hypothetical protein DCO56_14335 [Sphingobacterium athyrii]|uniref:Uncharacterized protein n=2 Tax=Sphingobacterium athyrii TaxID=2152717 RepID=A0A363NUT3_9SPHI|nr:hypothetical protein DCO56_14335 [Sphingobacterium athyrii]